MDRKQIIDLASAESFNEGDLMLIRKSGMGVDRKITYADFVESIGSPAINGYVSSLDDSQENKIILKAANNASVHKYYEGMKISFMAPAKSSGVVQVRIGQLGYKNLYQRNSDITIALEEDDYIEAVLIGEHFYQINDFEPVANIELETTDSFNEGDLMLIRKSGMGVDQKITYADFVESIGSPAINGYVSSLDESQVNKIILKTANNSPVYKYYEGMKISFTAPARSTGVVQVRIGQLDYKNLYRHQSDITVALDKDDYVEAVLIGQHFYQINDLKTVANIYTNDYVCAAHNESDIATDLTLVSAYGLSKQEYYNGMSITFMCPIDTKGVVRVNIDRLGLKDLIEGDVEDFLYNTLYKGQIVHAVFNGVCFVKNKFKVEDPKIRASLEPSPISQVGETPQAIVPLENVSEYNVGSGENCHFPSLRKAVEELLSLYSDTSGRRVTLNILNELTFAKDSMTIQGRDLSWITLKGDSKNQIKILHENLGAQYYQQSYDHSFIKSENNQKVVISRNKKRNSHDYSYYAFLTLYSCEGFNFAKDTSIIYNVYHAEFSCSLFDLSNSNCNLKNITVELIGTQVGSMRPVAFCVNGSNVTFDKVILKGAHTHLYLTATRCIVSLTNCKFINYIENSILMNACNSEINITNCDLSKNGTSAATDIKLDSFAIVTQTNSKAKATCAANTVDNIYRYIVTGSQDEVGTDN